MTSAASDGGPIADFAAVYAENVHRIYGFVAYRVRSEVEAEDLTQTVFEKAYRAWRRFDPQRSAPSTWLLSIARNVLIDHFRRRREELMGDESVVAVIDASAGFDATTVSPELAAALAALPPREQTVLALRFGADLTGKEIAEVVGLSTDNVHQILSRSLRGLRAGLEGY